MPITVNRSRGRKGYRLPGAWRHVADGLREAIADIDERAARIKSKLHEAPELRYVLDVDAHERRAIVRRLEAMDSGEPQLIQPSSLWELPGAEDIPFVAPFDLDEITRDEYPKTAWLIRVFSDDTVRVGQTRKQAEKQSELVGQGYKHGRINDDGDWQPTALNPSTGEWQDIKPGDVVIQGGSVTQVEDGTFTQTDEQRTGNLFNPTPGSDR
jgi:hypothetical protein